MIASETNAQREQRYLGYMGFHTGKCSLVVRMIYGVMAVMALYKGLPIPHTLMVVAALDVCQYLYASAAWTFASFRINNKVSWQAPSFANLPTNVLFFAKGIVLVNFLLAL